MPPKRKLADVYSPQTNDDQSSVRIKGEISPADYSQDVKKKLNATSRTGAACDRCRVRKMRCDDQPAGCGPCRAAHAECKTTDRITGKAAVRGYVENLERHVEELKKDNEALSSRLFLLEGHTRPSNNFVAPVHRDQTLLAGAVADGSFEGSAGRNQRIASSASASDDPVEEHTRLPEFRGGLIGNNYLGVSTGNSLLSSLRGTSMNVLGMEIDLTDYMCADLDEPDQSHLGDQPVYNKSYSAFIQTAFGGAPRLSKVELPSRSEGMTYAEYFFRVTNPFMPIVHKPTFMAVLTRVYDDPTFKPSVAETVLIHTMFAIMFCQIASRASQDASHKSSLTRSSNFHYHYALGFFPQLMASHTLADVQGLALLCLHVRNLPKPGACWMLASISLNLAIELGLHRSAKNWAPTTTKRSVLEIEIRKRVFWSILVVQVIVAGNLGRPMALSSGDWDVEMPEKVDDDYLSEERIDTSIGQCNFLTALQAFRIVPIYLDLFNSIYAVKRSPEKYEDTIRSLERRVHQFNEQYLREMVSESSMENELGRVHAQYCQIWPLHIRLLLHHPALSLTSSSDFNTENLDVCLEVSKKMLGHVQQLQKYRSLDGTWQTGALYVLAIATTLFGHWERRDKITPDDLATLRTDMESWLTIMDDVGTLLGSGRRLRETIFAIVEKTLDLLSQRFISKNNALLPPQSPQVSQGHSVPQIQSTTPSDYSGLNIYSPYSNQSNGHQNESNSNVASAPPAQYLPPTHTNPTPYPNPQQYPYQTTYPDNNHSTQSYATTPYTQPNPNPPNYPATAHYMNDFSQPQPVSHQQFTQNSTYTPAEYQMAGGPSSWRDFAGTMAPNGDPAPRFPSSGADLHSGMSMPPTEMGVGTSGQMWPLITFNGVPGFG